MLIDAVTVDTTRVAFVIIAFTLEVVKTITWLVEVLSSEPFTGRQLALTAIRRMFESSPAAATRWAALVQILANEKPRFKNRF